MQQGKSPPLRQRQSCLLDEGTLTLPIISTSVHSLSAEMTCPGTGDLEPKAKIPFQGQSFIEWIFKESSMHSHCRALPLQPAVALVAYLRRAMAYKKSVKPDGERSGLF